MKIYKSEFRSKPDLYYVIDINCGKIRKFIEWLWIRIEY